MASERTEIVVTSSGFHKTHVTAAACEASDRGLLALAITGAYPTERVRRVAGRLGVAGKGRIARLMERGEAIPEQRVQPLFFPELLDEAARVLTRVPLARGLYGHVSALTWRLYGWLAARTLRHVGGARIYLFRAGFGGASIERARELGMVALCDHAYPHPALLENLVENRGQLRGSADGAVAAAGNRPRDPTLRAIQADIERSDAVLVNSEFVKENFLALGWPTESIHVVYLGVDDNFLPRAETIRRRPSTGRLQLLFAGRLERRKGADVLVEALRALGDHVDWELLVAGPVTAEIQADHGAFLSDERVRLLGTLRRPELMKQMMSAPVFVFPSYAEGSARAVFEALACGCYVITTPNSGSIVEDGVHGALIPTGDAESLAKAITAADRDREMVAEVGTRNAEVVANHYRQVDYGNALAAVYDKLVAAQAAT